jgi:hypothetical protein
MTETIVKRQIEKEEEMQRIEDNQTLGSGRMTSQLGSNKTTIGHFIQNKQMVYDPMQNAILPDHDPSKPPPALVDISVLKKGGFNQINVKSKAAKQKEDLTIK